MTDVIDGFSTNTLLAERDILRERLTALEARLALGQVARGWKRITSDPATWPPQDKQVLVSDKLGHYWLERLVMHTEYDIDTQVGLWYLEFNPWEENHND